MGNTPLTIVVDQSLPECDRLFSPFGRVIALPSDAISRQSLLKADVLLVRSRTRVNEALLAQTPVKFVGSGVAGLDHLDESYLTSRGIPWVSAPGCNANAVAEYIIAALWHQYQHNLSEIFSKTLAIVGVGHVGRAVFKKAQALGIHCLLNDPPRARREGQQGFVDLETCLRTADVLTLHTPLTTTGMDATFHLLRAQQLALFKPNAVLINAARGDVIDESGLTQRSDLRLLFDCWHNEPDITPSILSATQLATPHIAGYSAEANLRGSYVLYQALCAHVNVSPSLRYEDLLPPEPKPIAVNSSPQAFSELLRDVLAQTTPLAALDSTLRHAGSTTPSVFKTLRSACQHRREWPAYRISPSLVPEDKHQVLLALGFKLI